MVVEITRHIAMLAQFPPKDVQNIALALDEAVTNAIKHSLKKADDEEIIVHFFFEDDGLQIRIIYGGIPPEFPREDTDLGEKIKKRHKGGLGLQLMKRIMDSVEFKRVDDCNQCEMIKWKKSN